VATALIAGSYADMRHHGIEHCYARIWHSNYPSLNAFEKANWQPISTVIEFHPFNLGKRLRWVFGTRRQG
jgi:hypothetical protein